VPRVLVVEDDAPIASIIADELAHTGFDVVMASNGGDALAELDRSRPDAIVLDLMLPVVDGWAFIEQYLEHTNGVPIPIVVVSAAGAVTRSMESLGVRHFLAKPFDLAQLTGCLVDLTGLPER
jgi:DNA-binding response OmpR family regulator